VKNKSVVKKVSSVIVEFDLKLRREVVVRGIEDLKRDEEWRDAFNLCRRNRKC